jgi:catechol 2,3-dioxygenase-like lactoylglutathione lyase family enzyme
MKRITVTELDHIVLNVSDIDRSLAFYTQVLGLEPERLDEFKAGTVSFPSVRINQNTIIDLFPLRQSDSDSVGSRRKPNLNHFCMVVSQADFSGIVEYLKENAVTIQQGPVARWGARGRATSVYFRDPDDNEIEIRCY